MALARIITRSHACSRELALDLLARGYAVEIVSPDAIPENLADLELRVDTGPNDQLIANVTAHDGDNSASLEFLHYLKSPMGDFIRRSPDLEAIRHSEQRVGSVRGSSIEAIELPAPFPQAVSALVSAPAEVVQESDLNSARAAAEIEEGREQPTEEQREFESRNLLPTAEPLAPFVADSALRAPAPEPIAHRQPEVSKPRNSSAGWPWRAVLTLAAVVLLALALGLSLRHTGTTSTQNSNDASEATSDKVSADKPARGLNSDSMPSPAGVEKDSKSETMIAVTSAKMAPASSDRLSQQPAVAKAQPWAVPSSNVAQKKVAPKHDNDVVARDTVTYLDDRYKPAPKTKSNKQSARHHPSVHKRHGDIIAANKVTYLDKPAPKASK
jgi:hypothetical protein